MNNFFRKNSAVFLLSFAIFVCFLAPAPAHAGSIGSFISSALGGLGGAIAPLVLNPIETVETITSLAGGAVISPAFNTVTNAVMGIGDKIIGNESGATCHFSNMSSNPFNLGCGGGGGGSNTPSGVNSSSNGGDDGSDGGGNPPVPVTCSGWSGCSASCNGIQTQSCSDGSSQSQSCSPPCPVITTFTATGSGSGSSDVDVGEPTTISWASSYTTSCVATGGFDTGGRTSGNVTITPLASTAYQITCSGPGGNTSSLVSITVYQPNYSISANPLRVIANKNADISWAASHVRSCLISGNNLSRTDYKSATTTASVSIPTQSTYTLTCQTYLSPVTTSVMVNVVPSYSEF